MFKTIAAVLHLGNIVFSEGSEPDSSKMADKSAEFHLTAVANLLGVEVEGLRKALTTRTRQTFGVSLFPPRLFMAPVWHGDSIPLSRASTDTRF